MKRREPLPLYDRIRDIIESARAGAARSVNTTQVVSNWLIGREIVEEEKEGRARADYGKRLIEALSVRMTKDYGAGYSTQNLFYMVQFYRIYPALISSRKILHAVRGELSMTASGPKKLIVHAVRGKSAVAHRKLISQGVMEELAAVRGKAWEPGRLNPGLCWTHYRTLLRVEKPHIRAFYEIEAVKNDWAARELERQINSLLYERLALSRDKKGVMRLAVEGHEARKPAEIFKDPVVMEFLGLPESPRLVETALEQALIGNLQAFLLEMGAGPKAYPGPPQFAT